MTSDQEYCIDMLCDWAGGMHHLPKIHEFGRGVAINEIGGVSTFDFDSLTRLVLLAHRDRVRIEICPNGGPGRLKIIAHRRKSEGRMHERHPSLDDLIETAGKYNRKEGGGR